MPVARRGIRTRTARRLGRGRTRRAASPKPSHSTAGPSARRTWASSSPTPVTSGAVLRPWITTAAVRAAATRPRPTRNIWPKWSGACRISLRRILSHREEVPSEMVTASGSGLDPDHLAARRAGAGAPRSRSPRTRRGRSPASGRFADPKAVAGTLRHREGQRAPAQHRTETMQPNVTAAVPAKSADNNGDDRSADAMTEQK